MTSYYDIDAILAEEELIPCINNFDFHHLPHLNPDNKKQYLPDESAIKMPLWAVKKWSSLGMVKISIPRIFGRKARERLEADPGDADLRYVPTFCVVPCTCVDFVTDKSTQKLTPGFR